jgi:hypothetical protein
MTIKSAYERKARRLAKEIRRNEPAGILESVSKNGRIALDTLMELLVVLKDKTPYKFHIAVEVNTGTLLKTIDNEKDAQQTIANLKKKAPKRS